MAKLKKNQNNGRLTDIMDVGTKGFDEFQAILLKRSKERTIQQKQNIELLTIKYQMEDYVRSKEDGEKSAGEFLSSLLSSLKIHQNKYLIILGSNHQI